MKKYIIAIVSIALTTAAGLSLATGGWQEPTSVTEFIIEGSPAGERIYVQFETDFNPDSCTGKQTQWKRIHGNTEKGKYLLSTVLSAKATGQTVIPLLYGCDDWGRPVIAGLWVQ